MRFADVVAVSEQVAGARARNVKVAAVAGALTAADPHEVRLVAHYLSGALPQRRTGVGWRSLTDLPEPASESSLEVSDVDAAMDELASLAGAGSAVERRRVLAELFGRATASEQRLLRGLFTGEVRQGALDGVLQTAIAKATGVPVAAVARAVMLTGFSAPVAEAALSGGEDALARIGLEVGRPLKPMLAASAPDIATALATVGAGGPVALERKLDGIRLQVHKHGETVRLFTRSLEDITDRLPEVVAVVEAMPARTAVVDAEALALRADGRPHPFQVTGGRTASSADPAAAAQATPVSTFAFDIVHLDGTDLLDLSAGERADILAGLLPAEALTPRLVTDDMATAEAFFEAQVAAGHEGVVVKSLTAPYAAGRRGAGWVKVKPRHTLDLVVLAVEWGSGRREGTLSNIHLGARDAERPGEFVMLGKTFKGMTDAMLAWQTTRFLELEAHREGYVVYVRPEQVVEIAYDGLQTSTRYPGSLALRFARVLRYRDDKTAEQADTIARVRKLASGE